MNKRISRTARENLIGYSFIIIWIIGFLVFMFYPLINSIIYSVSDVEITGTGIVIKFQGLKNFYNIFQLEEGFVFIEALGDFLKRIILQVPIIIVFNSCTFESTNSRSGDFSFNLFSSRNYFKWSSN